MGLLHIEPRGATNESEHPGGRSYDTPARARASESCIASGSRTQTQVSNHDFPSSIFFSTGLEMANGLLNL